MVVNSGAAMEEGDVEESHPLLLDGGGRESSRILVVASDTKHTSSTSKLDVERLSRLSRQSIFNEEVLATLKPETVDLVVGSPMGVLLQAALFITAALVLGLTPFFTQVSLWDSKTQSKVMEYNPQSVYIVQFLITLCLCEVCSIYIFGLAKALSQCYSPSRLVRYGPIGMFHALSESLEIVGMSYLDGGLRMILNQFKLPCVALLRAIFHGVYLQLAEWFSIAAIIISVIGFVWRDALLTSEAAAATAAAAAAAASAATASGVASGAATTAASNSLRCLMIGVGVALFCVFMSTCSFVYSDKSFKNSQTNYLIEMHCIRLPALCIMVAAMFIYCYLTGTLWKLPFHGWRLRTGFLVFWLCVKDFSQCYTIKALNSFWLALAYSAGLCIAYLADVLFMGRKLDALSTAFILIVACLIVSFSLTSKKGHGDDSKKEVSKGN